MIVGGGRFGAAQRRQVDRTPTIWAKDHGGYLSGSPTSPLFPTSQAVVLVFQVHPQLFQLHRPHLRK